MNPTRATRLPALRTALTAALLGLTVSAQDSIDPRSVTDLTDDFLVPLHQSPAHDATEAAVLWAAGSDYKASFGTAEGAAAMRFYPVLGSEAPRNLPFAWRTVAVSRGEVDLLGGAPHAAAKSPLCFEVDRGGFVERYDVREDGVYQSFVFAAPQADAGDLVIRGAVETELQAAAREGAHAPLAFANAQGEEVVRYGAAFALDAAGRRLPITSSFDGDAITLTVPSSWLAHAVWPVTVDPLTSRRGVAISGAALADPVIARDDSYNQRMVVYRRASAGGDWDLFARLMGDDFTSPQTVLSEVSATVSTETADVTATGGAAGRWVVAIEAETTTSRFVRLYRHTKNNATLNSGITSVIPRPSGRHDSAPRLGGSRSDTLVLVAFERDAAKNGSGETEVILTVLDASNGTLTPRRDAHDGGNLSHDAEAVSVSQRGPGNDDQWVIAWQERTNAIPNDDWDIQINRVFLNGTTSGMVTATTDLPTNSHAQAPQIAGERGMFGLVYLARDNTGGAASESGEDLTFRVVEWGANQNFASVRTPRVLASNPQNRIRLDRVARGFAFDTRTDSHFALAYEVRGQLLPARLHEHHVMRFAWNGEILEDLEVETNSGWLADYSAVSVVYDDDQQVFAMTYSDLGDPGIQQVFGRDLEYPAASATTYGAGCQGSISYQNRTGAVPPRAGSRFNTIALSGAAPNHPTWLFASVGPADLPLPIGGNGCRLLLSTQTPLITVGNWIAPQNGVVEAELEIPASTAGADVYWQFLQLVGPTLRTSDALHTAIR